MKKSSTPQERFGLWVQEHRRKHGISRIDATAKLRMAERYIYSIENGKTDFRLSTLVRIMEGLGMAWEDLRGILLGGDA